MVIKPCIAPKDDGSITIQVDYRNLNKLPLNTHYPILGINELVWIGVNISQNLIWIIHVFSLKCLMYLQQWEYFMLMGE